MNCGHWHLWVQTTWGGMKLWIMRATWGGVELWWNNGTYASWYVIRMIEKHAYSMWWGMWGKYVCGDWAPRPETELGRESQVWPFMWIYIYARTCEIWDWAGQWVSGMAIDINEKKRKEKKKKKKKMKSELCVKWVWRVLKTSAGY